MLRLAFVLLFVLPLLAVNAAQVWTGPTVVFEKVPFTDASLPENQDTLAEQVRLTRGGSQGLYNVAAEASFSTARMSPVDMSRLEPVVHA